MKHEWRKKEKDIYLPKNKPEKVYIPEFKFFTIKGEGNPNHDHFPEYIQVLYSLSYAVKMSPKSGNVPEGYFDYTVYPLEGIWDISEEAKANFDGTIHKDDFVFTLMIRQPEFLDTDFAMNIIEKTRHKKPHTLLDLVKFEKITDGDCVQMLHLGSYDDESQSFNLMEEFAQTNNLRRTCKQHREIYLSDFRKVPPEKLKTVLRFTVI